MVGAALEPLQVNALVARRVALLRKQQHLSLDALAARSGVSKGMVVQIEQRRANPSIATLTKLAASLRVSVADLVKDDDDLQPSLVRISQASKAPRLWMGPKGGSATLLIGSDGVHMVELWNWVLCPGEKYEAKPHPKGTVELFHVIEGTLALDVGGTEYLIASGCCASAKTDRAHDYRCIGRSRTRFTMVVHEPPADRDL